MAAATAAIARRQASGNVFTSAAVEIGHVVRHRLPRPRLTTEDVRALRRGLMDSERRYFITSAVVSGLGRGSDLPALRESAAARTAHYGELTGVLQQMGVAEMPMIVTIDGHVTGAAVGAAAHASACIVSERARLSLPGVAFGATPEAFAGYQLSRMPRGMGAYLSLTGATLSAREMLDVGIATHLTESQALWRVDQALAQLEAPHLGRALRTVEEVSIAPRMHEYSDADALFFADHIATCFGGESLREVVDALAAGDTPWHRQALELLRASSPLAAHVTFAALREARAADCWSGSLGAEARLATRALGMADSAAGGKALEAHKSQLDRELLPSANLELSAAEAHADADAEHAHPERRVQAGELSAEEVEAYGDVGAWEHESIEAVPASTVDAFFA